MKHVNAGDKVKVQWEHIEWIQGTVIYMPCATGDSWVIDSPDGIRHIVNSFSKMTVIKDFDPHP